MDFTLYNRSAVMYFSILVLLYSFQVYNVSMYLGTNFEKKKITAFLLIVRKILYITRVESDF